MKHILSLMMLLLASLAAAVDYPGPPPGDARANCSNTAATLENNAIAMRWTFADRHLKPDRLTFGKSSTVLSFADGECFHFVLKQSPDHRARTMAASELKLAAQPALKRLEPDNGSLRLGDRSGGWELSARLVSTEPGVEVLWRAVLRDGANYVRQHVVIQATRQTVELSELVLLELAAPGAEVAGSVDGSPVLAGNAFVAVEHPMSRNEVMAAADGSALIRCRYPHGLVVEPQRSAAFSCVIGVVPERQKRRGFLHYLERERPVPYRTFLHDNCASQVGGRWFWNARLRGTPEEFERYVKQQEKLWLDRIAVFGRELVEKRGVVMDSFVHDHGWDDPGLVWKFHKGFPNGFANAREAAAKYRAGVGVWLSPSGGYSGRTARVEAGQRMGFETVQKGARLDFTLAGPRYFNHFREACSDMVRNYGVNYFKFDRFAASNNQPGPGVYAGDVLGLLRLCDDLRQLKPDVFLNPTAGTWPSPFWLLWADAIWRQEHDHGQLGRGSDRQQWITYRDNAIYQGTVRRGPLVPIANLMLHGIIIHKMSLTKMGDLVGPGVSREPADVTAEIRSYFATGTCMPELHIDTSLMTDAMWDTLAEAANWSRRNADVLADSHWIGGNPALGEIYGWAAWSRRKATLALRNPNDQPATFKLYVAQTFELPAGAPRRYVLKSPWKSDAAKPPVTVSTAQPHEFRLQPFEVAVWDCEAQ